FFVVLGGGFLLRPQHLPAKVQSVRHPSQIRRRDACRGGDRPPRRARSQEGEPSAVSDCQRRKMKPAPYGPFPYSPIIRRPRLTWPQDAHVALWAIPNIEFFSLMEE